jgi:allantoate deiminase
MRGFGLDPDAIPALRRDPATVAGYVELHIEQGPVLQDADVPLGVVTAICGIERHEASLTGTAAHAGTTPMRLRRDALAGAAEVVLATEALAREGEGLMATVGRLGVEPNVVNAVPGRVAFTLEVRSPDDARREAAGARLAERVREIAAARGLDAAVSRSYAQPAQPCDAALADRVAAAAGDDAPRLPSGATHDASAMADLCPAAMLFVRCRDGVSHHPDEHVTDADLDAAVRALMRLLAA